MNYTSPSSRQVPKTGSSASYGWGDAPPVPSVVLREVLSRPRPTPHVVVFANEKGGVGKSTLAFHSCVALSYSGARVLAIDLDRRQRSLFDTLEVRAGTARALNVELPRPRHVVLEKQSGAMLDQELLRFGRDTDFVVIDLPGLDSPITRYAIAIANTLVTPVGNSIYDISGLGKINPVSRQLSKAGVFGQLVSDIRSEQSQAGSSPLDWLVLKNRIRATDQRLEAHTDDALAQMAQAMNFRLGAGFPERLGFRDLLIFGLTYLDLGQISGLGKRRHDIEENIIRVLDQLELPGFDRAARKPQAGKQKALQTRSSTDAFSRSLETHMGKPQSRP